MSAEFLNENQYHNTVASIACLNDCKLVGLNFSQQIIDIAGSSEAVQTCCSELEELFGRDTTGY